jgi:hypothetical protein
MRWACMTQNSGSVAMTLWRGQKLELDRLRSVPKAAPLWETRPARLRGPAVDRDSRTGRVTYPTLG